ncbi:MAG: T9SS type A sorting domain-containing protein, partial [Bacteroidia bacterium]
PANDVCTGAVDLSTAFGQAVGTVVNMGPYDNTNATTDASDPATGWQCFGEPNGSGSAPTLENTLWFTFVGDGNPYFIETGTGTGVTNYIDDGDTQFALYSGACGSLTPVQCNEDGPSATATTYPAGFNVNTVSGTTYYLMVDGFNFNGAISTGQFLIKVKKLQTIPCNDPVVTVGSTTKSKSTVCAGDSVDIVTTGAASPFTGSFSGMSWVITTDSLQTVADLVAPGVLVASYGIVSYPVGATYTRRFINNGALIDGVNVPYGKYYWTALVYGNAVVNPAGQNNPPIFLSDLSLDTACVTLGVSQGVMIYEPNDPACAPVVLNNDTCLQATDISSGFGQGIGTVVNMGPYDNTNATTGNDDPTTGWACFGEPNGSGSAPELNNTQWFTFVGDGNPYFIETGTGAGVTNYIDDGDTQFALYSGACGSLTPVLCNEDGPSATATTYPAGFNVNTVSGTTYFLMVDGFSFNGAVSTGQYLIKIKRLAPIACNAATVTAGSMTANKTSVCENDSVDFVTTGASSPFTGAYNGLSWVITTDSLQTVADLVAPGVLVASYGLVTYPVGATYTRRFRNDGSLIDGVNVPYGKYYWTQLVYGNATENPNATNIPPVFLSDLSLDTACVKLGISRGVIVYEPNDPACNVGVVDAKELGIMSVFPIPAKNEINFTFAAKRNQNLQVRITDVAGREVMAQNFKAVNGSNEFTLNISDLNAGVYFLNVNDGENTAAQKFVKE